MSAPREPIAVIGTGYVGLVTAAGFAELGSDVFCVDVDAAKIARLRAGEVPIYEPGLEEALAAHRERLHFSTALEPALEGARLLFVCVGTPSTYSGDADLSAVRAVVEAMPDSDRHALVMKSTVPPGTGGAIKRDLAARDKGLAYVSCPEFLREGSGLDDFRSPDRVVVGDDRDWAGDAVVELYSAIEAPLVRTDVVSAEMVKLASNAFLSTKISFINEIANVCEETGADVTEVARGMGLDPRIGPSFLQAGIGYGGSCLPGDETVLVRRRGRTTLIRFDALWERLANVEGEVEEGVVEPADLDVLSWAPDWDGPRFMPVLAATRREIDEEIVEVCTKMGRRIRCTADHPWVVAGPQGEDVSIRRGDQLTSEDWIPIAQGRDSGHEPARIASLVGAVEVAGLGLEQVMARPPAARIDELVSRSVGERREIFRRVRNPVSRANDVKRSGVLRLDEMARAAIPFECAHLGTVKNGSFVSSVISLDEAFWRVVGLYIAEGHCSFEPRSGRRRLSWSFHPSNEQHLVDEVVGFWLRHGMPARVHDGLTAKTVTVSSRLLATWWIEMLGLGRNAYSQRLPDVVWDRPDEDKWALLSGLWEGDGSWSLVNQGPSVILEFGTISSELADGVLRLLGDLGVVASQRIGRTRKSSKRTHWLRISGAEQVQRAIRLVPERDRRGVRASIALQRKRIAPTGYRRFDPGVAWVRVTRTRTERFRGSVYSLEVPGTHTFVTSGGNITHNCFPKDVDALKQLAGNTGYHFQLLGSVIEVNDLQKRRVVAKLQKHLGELVGKRVTLLGLAFKPHTDDMREASSLVLAGRLHAEGADVRAYDPVAEKQARELMPGVEFAPSALDAVQGADACVLVTEWPELVALDWGEVAERMRGTLIVDGRNALDAEAVKAAGLTYEGIGRR